MCFRCGNHRGKSFFEARRDSKKESTVTTEPGFHSTLKAADLCIYVGEQGATLSTIFFPVYLHEEQREGYRFMEITVQKCRS